MSKIRAGFALMLLFVCLINDELSTFSKVAIVIFAIVGQLQLTNNRTLES